MNIYLRGGAARFLAVDTDLWIGVLDLALSQGWSPQGIEANGYTHARGQRVESTEAKEIARCLGIALPEVSDSTVPLQDHPFGEDHTRGLIERVTGGGAVGRADVTAAYEILSGSPKADAQEVLKFLGRGGFTIELV